MSNGLPAPLTPADCDLRGYEWMPLLGHRLFASDFDARASDLEFRVALRLWWEAWQQVPAASLPNDDAVLCRLAGLGRDTKTWKKLRGGMALHGFTLCADNRWYHHLLAEQAIKAYDCRLKHKEGREAATDRMRRWRAQHNGPNPPENPNGQDPPSDRHVTRHNGSGDASHTPSRDASVTSDVTRARQTGLEIGEEVKVSNINNLLTTSPASARAVEACQAPPPGTYGDPAIQIAAQTIVGKLGRKFESSAKEPPGKPAKRSPLVQAAAVLRGPLFVDDDVLIEDEPLGAPPRRGPCDPQRTVVEQYAHLLSISLAEAATRLGVAA